MIRLSNGHQFEYMAASGALGFHGKGWLWERPLRWIGLFDPSLFTTVIKTLTRYPRKGNLRWYNPFKSIRLLKGGVVNAVGLTNPGIERWRKRVGPRIRRKFSLIGSIYSEDVEELGEMAAMLNGFSLAGLEINASCPNTESDILDNSDKVIEGCQMVKEESHLPLILKLSVVHDIERIAPQIEGIIEAISINSVPWKIIYPGIKSPFAHLGGGGVSGKVAQLQTWKFLRKIIRTTEIPVIGPSVWIFPDIAELRKMGAGAISFGSVFMRYPWRPTIFTRKDIRR